MHTHTHTHMHMHTHTQPPTPPPTPTATPIQDSTKADAEQVVLHQQLIQSRRVSAPTFTGSFSQTDVGSGIPASPAAARAIVSAELFIPEDAKVASGSGSGIAPPAVSASKLASDQAEGVASARRPSFNPSDHIAGGGVADSGIAGGGVADTGIAGGGVADRGIAGGGVAGGGIAAASSAARAVAFDRHLPVTISSCLPVVAGAGGARWGNPFTSMVQAAAPSRPPPITEELTQPVTKLAPSTTQSSSEGGKQAAARMAAVGANASEVPLQSEMAAHMQRLGAVLERLAEEQSRQSEALREVSSAVAGQAGVLQTLVARGSVSC